MSEPAITVSHLAKRFRLYHEKNQSLKTVFLRGGRARFEEFWAVNDVSFEVPEGSTFGIIGSNGSGKSTMLKCLARILRPDRGTIVTRGRVSALLELGTGFHPELSGRENVFLNGSILGLRRREVERRFDEIVEFAGPQVRRHLDTPIKNYSSGMYVRLGFAVAINVDPDILLVDEVLAVGDEEFQRRCMTRFEELRAGGRTVVLVSHSLASVSAMCDTVALLNQGKLEKLGTAREVIEGYLGALYAERDQATDAALRWGSREVRITALEVLGPDRQPTDTVRFGERATFRFHYEADVVVERPVFHLAIDRLDGTLVANPNTNELAQPPERVAGSGYLDYDVPELRLIPGQYDLSAGVVDQTLEHVYDRRHRALRFTVVFGAEGNREVSGVVSLGGRFGGTLYPGSAAAARP